MTTTFIYGLRDPSSNLIRYIGKSDSPEKRLKSHIDNRNHFKTKKNSWIKSLISKGAAPLLEIIDEVHVDQWRAREIETIALFNSAGAKLVNGTIGGDGVKMTQASKDKQRESNKTRKPSYGNKGKTHSQGTRLKMSLAKLGTKQTKEHREKVANLRRGTQTNNNKPIKVVNLQTGESCVYRDYKSVVDAIGVSSATIWRGLKNKTKPHNKYTFKYVKSQR